MQTLDSKNNQNIYLINGTLASHNHLLQSYNQKQGFVVAGFEDTHFTLSVPREIKIPIIKELEEILNEKEDWKEEGVIISEPSVKFAINFIKNSIIPNKLAIPHIEINPDGEIGFTWRKKDRGIINIICANNGFASWAAYLPIDEETNKGNFKISNSISATAKNLIILITDSSENEYIAS